MANTVIKAKLLDEEVTIEITDDWISVRSDLGLTVKSSLDGELKIRGACGAYITPGK